MSMDDSELSSLIQAHATRHKAPDALRAGLRTQVALAEAGRATPPAKDARRWWQGPWGVGAGFATGLLCMALLQPLLHSLVPGAQPSDWRVGIEDELVLRHVHALGPGPLTEVVSTDRHTVKPWFQGRIDFAPPVFDLAGEGFPLLGGRVEPLRGRSMAVLAYKRRLHVIELFVRPSSEPGASPSPIAAASAPLRSQRQGFNVMHWDDGAMQYWLVSDLERSEVEAFVHLWQAQVAAQ